MQYHNENELDIILEPMKNKDKLSKQVYKIILGLIISGQIKAGSRLPVEYFSKKLAVSSTPIKEAFNILQSDGLLKNIPYQGFIVRKLEKNEIKNIYEARAAIESFAIRLTCGRIIEEEKRKLVLLQNRGEELCKEKNYKGYIKYNKQLHNLIVSTSNNDTLMKLFKTLEYQIDLIIINTIQVPGRPDVAVREHKEIIESILKSEEKKACSLIENHILGAMEDYLNYTK